MLAPKELRRLQLAALTNWVTAGGRPQPVVLVLEDLHWADPTTLDVLRGIAERGALVPLFVLLTARPEFRPSWGARSHHSAWYRSTVIKFDIWWRSLPPATRCRRR
jgi:predicted ATPase